MKKDKLSLTFDQFKDKLIEDAQNGVITFSNGDTWTIIWYNSGTENEYYRWTHVDGPVIKDYYNPNLRF